MTTTTVLAPDTPADLGRQVAAVLARLAAASEIESAGNSEAADDPAGGVDPTDANSAEMPKLMSITRAAKLLGVSRASAYRYAAVGDLPTVRLGGRRFVVTARLNELLGIV